MYIDRYTLVYIYIRGDILWRHLFKEFHQIFGLLILVILIFHIAGALKHSFVDKDGTLRRMWFSK